MPHFDGRGFRIDYVEEGRGPCVVFAHGFLMDHTMFAAQFEDLPDRYRCIAWDMRGHGKRDCPSGPWSMQDVVVDLIRFIEGTNAAPCHLVGMSWGGMAALRVAIQREDLVRSLVLIDTSADAEDPSTAEAYRGFQTTVASEDGISEELARATLPIFYGQPFMEASPAALDVHIDRATSMPTTAVVEGLRALIEREPVMDRLGDVHVRTLVIHGELDAAIPLERAQALAHGVAGAELVTIPSAGHTTPLEAPDAVNAALARFFASVKR